jgi:hypothetical protein
VSSLFLFVRQISNSTPGGDECGVSERLPFPERVLLTHGQP